MTTVPVLCGITSALLHYFMLVFFTWTAVETVWLYIKLVKIIGTQSLENKFMIKAGIPAWGELPWINVHVRYFNDCSSYMFDFILMSTLILFFLIANIIFIELYICSMHCSSTASSLVFVFPIAVHAIS